ncbi:uncharacterized protein BDZ99DRAFT_527883 [Mytilinidion resinicola]|uniref:Uncharacterized protein n=1 Tax=Mytilinidion resinicola TaxID=574789 RepID=A0A6A6XZU0_9PEZI|nr:uncharacterized protein BDZ99DRAFT_527883 [Mytilinidion resinicola]KAF2801920.1 hypothetical protein BDZ99DRAFT_527883 [Mytilinidion resinicola]
MSSRYGRIRVTNIPYDNETDYRNERIRRYPNTYYDDHPSQEAEDDYNAYSTHTDKANRAATESQFERDTKSNLFRSEKDKLRERKYYKKYDSLFPEQHSRLVEPALDASFATENMAVGRHKFLESHPLGYNILRGREKHVDYFASAQKQWELYDKKAQKHAQYASDPEINEKRDQYGRLRPRYEPSDDEREEYYDDLEESRGVVLLGPSPSTILA